MTELAAGRELDALVAEKVMGARWARVMDMRMLDDGVDPEASWYSTADGDEPVWPHGHSVRPYSTSISAAWQVVKAMQERGWPYLTVQSFVPLDNNETVEWWAELDHRTFCKDRALSGHCASAAEAICRAALKAVAASEFPTAKREG